MAKHDNILIGRLVKQQRGFRHQRVEPAARLVNRLRDKLCRKLLLEQFLIFKRIVMLCKRHGAGVKPAVNNLWNPAHLLAAVRAFKSHLINIRSVQLDFYRVGIPASVRKLLPAADALLMAALALPHIERRSPVTIPRDAPVLNVLKPVAKTPFSDRLWNPVDCVVVAHQVLFYRCHLDKP